MSFVIPVALQIHFFSKNKNDAGYMQEPNRTLLNKYKSKKIADIYCKYGFEILADNNPKVGRKYLVKAIHYSYFCWQAHFIYLFSFLGKSGVGFLILMQRVKRFLFGFSSGTYVSKTGRT